MNQSEETQLALMKKDIKDIKDDIREIKDLHKNLPKYFVSRTEFWPIKTLVYGFVSMALLGVFGALIALVIN